MPARAAFTLAVRSCQVSVRGVVVDVSDTLLQAGRPVGGIDELWNMCRRRGLRIIVASNQPFELQRLRSAGYKADYEADPAKMGIRKPSPLFILSPAADFG